MRERFGHEKNGSRTRSGGSRTRKAASAREERLAHEKNRSRTRKRARAQEERLGDEKNRSRATRAVRAEPGDAASDLAHAFFSWDRRRLAGLVLRRSSCRRKESAAVQIAGRSILFPRQDDDDLHALLNRGGFRVQSPLDQI